jgi:hypothetical protein
MENDTFLLWDNRRCNRHDCLYRHDKEHFGNINMFFAQPLSVRRGGRGEAKIRREKPINIPAVQECDPENKFGTGCTNDAMKISVGYRTSELKKHWNL